jgi:hypothetical protein
MAGMGDSEAQAEAKRQGQQPEGADNAGGGVQSGQMDGVGGEVEAVVLDFAATGAAGGG